MQKFRSSTLLWIILALVLTDLFLVTVRPLRFVHIPGLLFADEDAIGDKVSVLCSPTDQSNVLLLGTSLLEEAAACADAKKKNLHFTQYTLHRYLRAETLDSELRSKCGLPAKSLAVPIGGGLFYDSYLLVQKSSAAGKRPSLIVFTVAPRDFVDGQSVSKNSAVACYFNWRFKDIKHIADLPSAVELALVQNWNFYRLKSDYKTIFQVFSCSALDRAPTLFASTHKADVPPPTTIPISISFTDKPFEPNLAFPAEHIEATAKQYDDWYEQLGRNKSNEEFDYLSKALQLCHDNDIPCLVVSMPLGELNRRQLAQAVSYAYKARLSNTCNSHGVKLINLMEDVRFSTNDFLDNVHLNANGAIKFWRVLGNEINKDAQYLASVKKAFDLRNNQQISLGARK